LGEISRGTEDCLLPCSLQKEKSPDPAKAEPTLGGVVVIVVVPTEGKIKGVSIA